MLETVASKRWIEVNGAICFVPNKSGSTSFRVAAMGFGRTVNNYDMYDIAAAEGRGPWTTAQVNKLDDDRPRYLAIREPVDRFTSLWKHANRSNERRNKGGFLNTAGLLGASPERLMSVIEARPDADPHWARQSLWEANNVIPVRFDKMLEVLGLSHAHKNKSLPVQIPELPENRIRAHYARDCELWERAKKVTPSLL